MYIVYALFLILSVATAQEATDLLKHRECDPDVAELSVSLLQHSLAIVPDDRSSTDIGKVPVALLQLGRQLHDELELAKRARSDVLKSLQQWDERIGALEVKLSASKYVGALALGQTSNASLQTPESLGEPTLYTKSVKNSRMGILAAMSLLVVFYIGRTIVVYEANRGEKDIEPPWYLDCTCRAKVLGAGGLQWLLLGMIMFTEFMWFTDDHRHLTVIEAIYLTAQIVTTVGYGDLNPSTGPGFVFMAFYAFTGVAIIGTLAQQWISLGTGKSDSSEAGERRLGRYHEAYMTALQVFACIAFGTVFFSSYPGENKTCFEAFYMSVITLLTVGFGTYHPVTQVGKLVGAFYMFIGVAIVGSAIVSASDYIMKQQDSIRSRAHALKLFRECDEDGSGGIDQMEFLHFELLREGHPVGTTEILAKFGKLDADSNGQLDFAEFEAYVLSL